jgi:hypothetical protein
MINRPGRYQFGIDTGNALPAGATLALVTSCTLRQKP